MDDGRFGDGRNDGSDRGSGCQKGRTDIVAVFKGVLLGGRQERVYLRLNFGLACKHLQGARDNTADQLEKEDRSRSLADNGDHERAFEE